MSMWSFYLKDTLGNRYWISHELKERISIDYAGKFDEDDPELDANMKLIKYTVKLYSGIHL
jgi:hypothetical protein